MHPEAKRLSVLGALGGPSENSWAFCATLRGGLVITLRCWIAVWPPVIGVGGLFQGLRFRVVVVDCELRDPSALTNSSSDLVGFQMPSANDLRASVGIWTRSGLTDGCQLGTSTESARLLCYCCSVAGIQQSAGIPGWLCLVPSDPHRNRA